MTLPLPLPIDSKPVAIRVFNFSMSSSLFVFDGCLGQDVGFAINLAVREVDVVPYRNAKPEWLRGVRAEEVMDGLPLLVVGTPIVPTKLSVVL